MTELNFHSDLYSGFAIDAATKVYGDYASFELEQDGPVFRVRVTSKGEFNEREIADEFANYALGAMIESAHRDDDLNNASGSPGGTVTEGS